jgi:hypothetical protein
MVTGGKLPATFRGIGEPTLVNYDYVDFASGTGYQTFYGITSKDQTGLNYHLTESIMYANDIETSTYAYSIGSFNKEIDVDFDLTEFNLPRTVRGTATINIQVAWENEGGNDELYVIPKLVHYDGTTETTIGSAQSETFSSGTALGKMLMMKLALTETVFKSGDILRLTIEVWAKQVTAQRQFAIGHDPQGRAGSICDTSNAAIETTKLEIQVPFKVDI